MRIHAFREMIARETDECIEWPYGGWTSGYGCVYDPSTGKTYRTHRLAIDCPPDKQANHTCDNRRCINPRHLYVGDQADNIRDRDARTGNGAPTERKEAILADLRDGTLTQSEIARKHGVSRQRVSFLAN